MLVGSDTPLETSISSDSGNGYLAHTLSLFLFRTITYIVYVGAVFIVESESGLLSVIEYVDDVGVVVIPIFELLCILNDEYFIFGCGEVKLMWFRYYLYVFLHEYFGKLFLQFGREFSKMHIDWVEDNHVLLFRMVQIFT